MAHEEAEIVRWHLSFKERDHVLPDGTRRGQNREVTLVLQRARPHTHWWHTKRPKSWGDTCPSKSKITYRLMAHEEAKIVRWHLSFKERDHVQSDGTRRGQNREVALVFQRARYTYRLMAHEEAEIVRWHLSFRKRDHVQADGTWRGQNCEVTLVLQRARRTPWWHTKRPKSWGDTCPSKSETTYILIAHEEAEIVRWRLSFKEWDHIHTDGTRRGQNREVALVLQRLRSRTPWWHTKRPTSWGGTCPSKRETTYSLMAHEDAEIVRWHLSFKKRDHVQADGTRRGQNCEWHLCFKERDHVLPNGTRRGRNGEVALVL